MFTTLKRDSTITEISAMNLLSTHHLSKKGKKKPKKRKIDKNPNLKKYVKEGLKMSWSPEQIVGRMKLEGKNFSISTESIYAYLFLTSTQHTATSE